MNKRQILGAKLQYYRKTKGIKQEYVAKKLNVSKSYISKLENGKIPLLFFAFIGYCDIIGISPIDILSEILL